MEEGIFTRVKAPVGTQTDKGNNHYFFHVRLPMLSPQGVSYRLTG